MSPQPCPCDSGRAYADCCRRWHEGAAAPTAEALMRSRYAAYALGLEDHLFRTWHPRTRPEPPLIGEGLTWTALVVLRAEGGEDDETGTVEFEAHYRYGGKTGVMREVSAFERRRGRWVYVAAMR